MADIMFAGTGGQGVLTAGKILIEIGAENGKNVCWTSEYSAEMRGGIALCRVVISDEEIGNPYPDLLDVLCCMSQSAYDSYAGQLRKDAVVICNSPLFENPVFPQGTRPYGADTAALADEAGNPRGANLVLMGAMIRATQMLDPGQCMTALKKYFEKKGIDADSNLKCFQLGYDNAAAM